MDGAGPMRFFWDVVVPLSKTTMGALFVISSSTAGTSTCGPAAHHQRRVMYTVVIASAHDRRRGRRQRMEPDHGYRMLAMLPPALVCC